MADHQAITQQEFADLEEEEQLLKRLLNIKKRKRELQELPATHNNIINLDEDSDVDIKQEPIEHTPQSVDGDDGRTKRHAAVSLSSAPQQPAGRAQNDQARQIGDERPAKAHQQFPVPRPTPLTDEGDQITRELIIKVSKRFPNIIRDPTGNNFIELCCPDPECRANSRHDGKYFAGLPGLGQHVAAHDPQGYGRMKYAELLPHCIKRSVSIEEVKTMLRRRKDNDPTKVTGKGAVPGHWVHKSRKRKQSVASSRAGRDEGGQRRPRAQNSQGTDSVGTEQYKSLTGEDPKVTEIVKDSEGPDSIAVRERR